MPVCPRAHVAGGRVDECCARRGAVVGKRAVSGGPDAETIIRAKFMARAFVRFSYNIPGMSSLAPKIWREKSGIAFYPGEHERLCAKIVARQWAGPNHLGGNVRPALAVRFTEQRTEDS